MSNALQKIACHFRNDPVGYAKIILGVTLTPPQQHILRLLTQPPKKVLVRAAHNVGKTFLAAVAALWWYDTRNPGICLATAPTHRQVQGVLFKEIRTLRGTWGGWSGPKICHLQDSPHHFLHGFTSNSDARFQGHHEEEVLVIFDEATGIDPLIWQAAESMLTAQLCIYNPTDQSSAAYTAERSGNYHVVGLSALDHPNIAAELQGRPAPYPSAIRLGRFEELVKNWCTPLTEQPIAGDFEFPRNSGKWWRPSPVGEARLLGRWPTLATNSVWTETIFQHAMNRELSDEGELAIAADPARYGDDNSSFHVRKGAVSLHHESHNGWSTSQTAARLRELAEEYGRKYDQRPKEIPCLIDDTGVGGGVTDQCHGYNFVPVNAASQAHDPSLYPNLRSQLWFNVADQAAQGEVSFARLPTSIKEDLRRELLAPTYSIDYQGRRVVEKKQETKKRIGRSPDIADAMHLAYYRPKYHQGDTVQFRPLNLPKKDHKLV